MTRFFFTSLAILSIGCNLLQAQIPIGYNSGTNYPVNQQPKSNSTISNFQQGKIDTKKRETAKQLPAISLNDTTNNSNSSIKNFSNNNLTGNQTKSDSLEKLIFGKSFFQNKSLLFQPNLRIATPQNYIVGPDRKSVV